MTDYTKLVEALRYCAETPEEEKDCKLCEYYPKCSDVIAKDAAAAIEDLQKDLTTLQKCYEIADTTVDKVAKQLPKRGEWITIRLNNGGSYTGCSCCEAPIPTDTMLDYIPESESKYCYSCGAKMGVQDEQK